MRKLLLLFPTLLVVVLSAQNTVSLFRLTDTTFKTFSVYRGCTVLPSQKGNVSVRPEDQPCLDSIAALLIAHPGMIIEIGSHTDQRGSDTFNLRLSQQRANEVKKYLETKSIPPLSVVAVGYGESQPIHKQEDILKLKSKQLQEDRYAENRRIEFTIIVFRKTFALTDTSFEAGDVLCPLIWFDLAKATLRPESKLYLDTVAEFLIGHPQLKVEIGNHSDARQSDKLSSRPCDARAKAIADYLISKGVPSTQITHVGYGWTKPLITEKYILYRQPKEAQEQLHQLNRRTEFVITSVGN